MALTLAHIEHKIYTIRGVQVMLDSDLADLYQVETKVLNQAVKRNIERFPEKFRFQLNKTELAHSRSQIVTLNNTRGHNIKYLPFAFTEQGVAMLSAVLKSNTAIQISIQIMDAFIALRKTIHTLNPVLQRLDTLELKQLNTDAALEKVFKALEADFVPKQGVFLLSDP